VNASDKSTRARARIGAYALNRTNPQVAQLLRSLTVEDFEGFTKVVRQELTPAGFELLKTILRMSIKTPVFGPGKPGQDEDYQVKPFTRSDLGDYLRKGERLNPHDIKLVNHMVKLSLLREVRQSLPVRRIRSPYGDELQQGAGWEYVYVIPPVAALSLLYATKRHQAYILGLQTDQTLDYKMPADSDSWKRWLRR
jgi:hypothetical protein